MNNDAFLILFLVFLALISLLPLLFRKFKVPSVIVLLVTGMLIGPNGIDLLGHLSRLLAFLGSNPEVIEDHSLSLINSLGALGLVLLMALAGLEADFKLIGSVRKPVIWLSLMTFLLPAVSGYLVYQFFRQDDFPGKLLYASLFASHSVGIVFPVIRELKLARTKFGAAVLISTVVTDIGSIILLAVSVQTKRELTAGSGSRTLSIFDYLDPGLFGGYFVWLLLLVALLYLVVAWFLVNRLGGKILNFLGPREDALVTFMLLIVLLTVLAGEFLGINLVVGAFVAGLALSRVVRQTSSTSALFQKFEGIGYGLLIPFLFISIGMKTDFRILFRSPDNWSIILFTVIGLVGSKVFSGWLALRISGFSNLKGLCAGLMTVPQLSATLAAAAIGKDLGMLDDNFFNAIVVLSIVTTLPVPTLVRLFIEKFQLRFEHVEEAAPAPYELPADTDQDELL